MTLPPDKIGDKGRRYEIRALDEDDEEFVVGWSDVDDGKLNELVNLHPSWHSPRTIDRHADSDASERTNDAGS